MKLPSITRLKSITCFEDQDLPGRFCEVVLSARSRRVSLRCDPDSDEVVISTAEKSGQRKALCLVSGDYRVEWVWKMTNQQGYSDGFRIQLASARERRVFDIIAIASCLQVYEAVGWPNPQGGANGRQPLRSQRKRKSVVAASRRSP
jgi:hypothetical protein